MQLTSTLLFTCSWSSRGVDELLPTPLSSIFCLQFIRIKSKEWKRTDSTVMEFKNCSIWFELGDFIWDLQLAFAFRCWLGNRWQQPCTVLLSLQSRGSSSCNIRIARGMSSYCTDFRVGFVFRICSYTPLEAFFQTSVCSGYTLQLASFWEAISDKELQSKTKPFFSEVLAPLSILCVIQLTLLLF